MRRVSTRTSLIALTGLSLSVLALWLALAANRSPAQANHSLSIGIDTDTAGNSALSLGTVQACRTVSLFQLFDMDLYVTGLNDLSAWEAYITYDPAVFKISKPGDNNQNNNSRFLLQQAQPSPPGNNLFNTSETLPDSDGIYRVGAVDLVVTSGANSDPGTGQHENGVLVRLEVQAIASGFSPFKITPFTTQAGPVGPFLKNGDGNLINDTNADGIFDGPISNAIIVVGASCSDSDADGVPDSGDNCPTVPNPDQLNFDRDSQGDACDPDDDNDGLPDTSEPAACRLDTDCDNDNVSDGSNDPDGGGPIKAGPDNCILVRNTDQKNNDGDALGDACDPDDDNDGVADASDNCQFVANGPAQAGVPHVGNQADTDLDGAGDACDIDDDNDGFSDTLEQRIGTDQADRCANTAASNDEIDDRWGADFDDNQTFDIGDFGSFLFPVRPDGSFNKFGHRVPDPADPTLVRWDIEPNSVIDIGDLGAINPAVTAPTARPPMFGGEPAFGKKCA